MPLSLARKFWPAPYSLSAYGSKPSLGDKQFLKSMIPHQDAAILMVKEANLSDPEIKQLGSEIIVSQQKEIDFMKAKNKGLKSK